VEYDLENGPFLGLEEPPRTGAEDECVPCGNGKGTDEEVFVGGQMGREVEGGREESGDIWGTHGWLLTSWLVDAVVVVAVVGG
jgi:hypothetical protein